MAVSRQLPSSAHYYYCFATIIASSLPQYGAKAMLNKIVPLIALIAVLLLGNQMLTWLMQIDMTVLREITTSILIALVLQPLIMHQFR
jgi:hypothetical protein